MGTLLGTGCASGPNLDFTFASNDLENIDVEILAPEVLGRSCSEFSAIQLSYRAPSYTEAVSEALASVPNANVLVNARFTREQWKRFSLFTSKVCAVARGAAGRLE